MTQFKVANRAGILFLGGAKRVAMARNFKSAAKTIGMECAIYGYELSRFCPLACEGEIIEGRRWRDTEILEHIHSVVEKHNIDIIIPFVDPAVAVAADYCKKYGDAFTPSTSSDKAELMFDKVLADQFFSGAGIPVPPAYDGSVSFPLIAKPRNGSASKGIKFIDSEEDIKPLLPILNDYLIQRRFDRRDEITVDCYVNVRSGMVQVVSPRYRLEVAGGEVVRTLTFFNEAVDGMCRDILAKTELRGAVTIQLIRDRDTDSLYIMEINPRLGGGAVATVNAGADLTLLILEDALGMEAREIVPRPDVETCRYLSDVYFCH